MTDSVVVEGYARLRDGKKWRARWLVLRKPSPVADCLLLQVFKDKSDRAPGSRERTSVTLEEICGLEAGRWYEGVAFTLAIVCLNQAAVLGFDSKEALLAWDARLRYSLGEVHRFSVGVLPGTKLESGPATLHLCNNLLALARDVPPVIIGHWSLPDLRRYGPVPNGFVFEGGTRCGYWAGVFLLASAESERISFLFDCIVRGISPTRGPLGLRPVLPDPSASPTSLEERLNQEAQELEKRLSLLSHRSSAASSSYFPSAGGDDRSISGSSDTSDASQSDCSIGSQPEVTGHSGARAAPQSSERLPLNQAGGSRPAAKPPRQLQDIGRQSSSDSGIATGSHSSSSGSFSSYASSLDGGPGEDFGSVFSLPPQLAQELSPCSCLTVPGREYQVPSHSLRYLYDTPRSVLQEGRVDAGGVEPPALTAASSLATDSSEGDRTGAVTFDPHQSTTGRDTLNERLQGPSEEGKKPVVAPPGGHTESCHICSSKTIVTICSACGGFKGAPNIAASGSAAPAVSDQSVDKSPDTAASRNREKVTGFLADLLGFPAAAARPPQAKADRLNPYESMSRGLGGELRSSGATAPSPDSQQRGRAAIYENCFKCQGDRCRPPPRGTWSTQASPTGPRASQEHGGTQGREEDKRLDGKEERRRADPAYEIMESRTPERNSEAEDKSKYEPMGSCGQQRFLQETEGRTFTFPPEDPPPEKPPGEGATYVNIPVSPTSKKQLNYMELELQEAGAGSRGAGAHPPTQRKSSTKYAQIDITATETAHKVGTQHALGREEGLPTLELRRKGAPH